MVTASYGVEFFLPSILEKWYDLPLSRLTWLVIIPPIGGLIGQLSVGWSSDRTGERRLHGSMPIYLGAVALGCTLLIPASLSFNWRLSRGGVAVHRGTHGAEGLHAGVLGNAELALDRGGRRGKHRLDQLGGQPRGICGPVSAWLHREQDSLVLARSDVSLYVDDRLGHDHLYPRSWQTSPPDQALTTTTLSQKTYSKKNPTPSSNPCEISAPLVQ